MQALLLSAYDAGSHAYWRRGLELMLPDFQWRSLTLPPRHFSWRVRGNPLYWAIEQRAVLEQPADLLVATSMVDLATLRGLVPALCRLPTLLYFHENQFAYPQGQSQHGLLEAQMVSLYSALAADRIAFNSAYNRDSFLAGCDDLLQRLPDFVPPDVTRSLAQRAEVLAVPLLPERQAVDGQEPMWPEVAVQGAAPLRLVWVGRLEYDKGADNLERILQHLERAGLDYQLAVVGQEFRNRPAVFSRIETDYQHRLVHLGWIESALDYQALLQQADMVLSTALHEFQGIAVLEAVRSGCLPVVPRRLAYQELYEAQFCYSSLPDDPAAEAAAASETILILAAALQEGRAQPPAVRAFSLESLAPCYRRTFQALLAQDGH
ncbi:DUF3524 domain-containing protein [Parahaliea sp. F7430]|uniref:tRNA-queuosine alpha-mannosyltransferase n=1 Tax=Sediminihaliea albiluteola TaxID=2758564 RepID=A0A7W2YIX8_9GAMM|nr:DUF3524 domain-containing protein [Sediminihaliea albiluteola]MBA6412522.1 DUF3524 domain-containing protein [Sediminihaliea albiluteola]